MSAMRYAFCVIRSPVGPLAVVEQEGHLFGLSTILPGVDWNAAGGLDLALNDWEKTCAAVEAALSQGNLTPLSQPQDLIHLPPIGRPTNIVCAGSNYHDHLAKDFGITGFDKPGTDILYFTKQSGSLIGSGQTVRYPSQSDALDWEVELVVVIGRQGRRIPIGQAMTHVAGYMVGIDLTARDLQFNKRQRRAFDLFAGKSFDDSAPTGPVLVPSKFVDPDDLSLKLWVNGELRQDSHTRQMIWSVPELIADVSQHITLRPGDLIFTGSPAGIGMASGTYLKVGDRVEAEIGRLGRLSITIGEDPDAIRVRDRPALTADEAAQ
jgi:2-keto-4-pentenoate hydratase/2-oxohepta-3-ene-1,7-dioic acid hydratase in catechol pathway